MRTVLFSIFTAFILLSFAYLSALINVNPAGFLLVALVIFTINLLGFVRKYRTNKPVLFLTNINSDKKLGAQ